MGGNKKRRRSSSQTPGKNSGKKPKLKKVLTALNLRKGQNEGSSPKLLRRTSLKTSPQGRAMMSALVNTAAANKLDTSGIDLSLLTPSQVSTPLNRRVTRQMSASKANSSQKKSCRKAKNLFQSPQEEASGFIPLSPKMLVKSYRSQGFFHPPVTIDETFTEDVTPDKNLAKRAKEVTLEDGEILDANNDSDDEIQIVGNVIKYTKPGSEVRVEAKRSVQRDITGIEVAVESAAVTT